MENQNPINNQLTTRHLRCLQLTTNGLQQLSVVANVVSVLLVVSLSLVIRHSSLAEARQVYVGVFREGAPQNIAYIKRFEELVGRKPAMIMWYQDFARDFPVEDAKKVIEHGAVPHIAWEAWYWGDRTKVTLDDIIAGKWDNYVRSWAVAAKEFKYPVFIRFLHEFNIDQYPWAVVHNGKNPQKIVDAFRHVVKVFKKEGANNVKWIWCFNNYSYPDEPWNDWALSYPGDEYVDWVGIDGYNWGTTQNWSQWQAFKYLFRDQIRRAKKLWPSKPIIIAEFASAEQGGDKAVWIKEIPGYLKTSMRDIDVLVWFDLKKETDWQITSSSGALSAFKEIMKDPVFSSSGETLANLTVSPALQAEKKKVTIAYRTSSPIKIDGNLSDWQKNYPMVMGGSSFLKEGINWKNWRDLSGRVYLAWDENFFYLAADINDVIPLVNKKERQDIWNGDGIEITLSADPKANADRDSFSYTDYQFGFGTGDGKDFISTIWNWQRHRSPEGSKIAVKKREKPLGYVLEAKVPWNFFTNGFTPSSGSRVDFDIAIDDADYTGEREKQFIWNGDYYFYKDPSVWGILEFR